MSGVTTVDVRVAGAADAQAVARRGEVVVVKGAVAGTPTQALIVDELFGAIGTVSGADEVAHLRRHGLERCHDVLSPEQLHDAFRLAERSLAARLTDVAFPLVASTTGADVCSGYLCSRIWVRFHVPLPALDAAPEVASRPYVVGHLTPAVAHRDFTLTHPHGTLSYWLAVGRVQEGNSVRIWPGLLHDHRHDDDLPALGDDGSVAPALDPGDLLLFDTNHVHATVPNHTDETRVAITVRVAPRPLRFGPGPHWRRFLDMRLLGTPLEPLAGVRSTLTSAYVRRKVADRRTRTQRAATVS